MTTVRRKPKQSEKARRVAFYRNGDYFDGGVRLAFRGTKPFSTMPHLLDYLSQKVHMPVKKIFSLPDGKPVKSLDQLEDGKSYVLSSANTFEPLPYGSVPRMQTSHIAAALPTRPEDIQLLKPTDPNFKPKRKKKLDDLRIEQLYTGRRDGRVLTIEARQTGARTTLIFNDRNPPSFEEVLKDFGNALGLQKVQKMTTPSGRQVRSISQLKNEFQDADTFILDERDDTPFYKEVKKSAYSTGVNNKNTAGLKSGTFRAKQRMEEVRNMPRAEWIHGYDGGTLLLLESGELVYPVAAAIILYDRNNESQRHYLGHTEDVCSICTHPRGRMMASGQVSSDNQPNATVHIWMIETLQIVSSITRLTGNPVSLAFSSHDYVLMTVEAGPGQDCISFWDWESDALLGRVEMQGERLTGGTFHPKEPELAVTFGVHHLAFWRRRSDGFLGRSDALAPGHSGRTILSWAFVGDSSLAVGDSSGYVTLWALLPGETFKIIKEVKAHQSDVRCLLAMREGTLISGGGDQLKAWDSHQRLMLLASTDLPEGEVRSISLQGPNSAALYVGTIQSILEGSIQSSFKALIEGIDVETLDLAVDSEGASFVSVDQAHNIYRWTSTYLMWKTKSLVDLCSVGYHPEGRAVTAGGTNGKLLVLHADGGMVVATISVADVALKVLAYDSDGANLAIGCEDGNIYICESRNHGYIYKMYTVLKNEWPILHIDWSSDGECLQSAYRKEDFCEVTTWKVSESKVLKSSLTKSKDWPEHTCNLSHNIIGIWKKIRGAYFYSCHRKGSKLATGAQDGYIRIFPYPYGENIKDDPEEWKQSSQPANLVRFLRKNILVTTSGSAIFIWRLNK